MVPILLTTTNGKQPDAVVAWDPLGGCPIATLSGETAYRGSLTPFVDGVVCAAAKKPFIQLWSLQSPSTHYKRILTKGLVSAIALTPDSEYIFVALEREVYVYQTSSGCLIGVLGGSHSAKIAEMLLVNWLAPEPTMLLTADASGFLACWSLGSLVDELSLLTNSSSSDSKKASGADTTAKTTGHTQITPLWYTLQSSHHLPRIDVFQQLALIVGSEGLKVHNLLNGHIVATTLSDVAGGLHSIQADHTNGKTFCGGADGLLYVTQITFPEIAVITNREVRRCFLNSKLPNMHKTITELALAPFDQSLLAVGARSGLIEVLRPDSVLTCLHQFSVLNPTLSKTDLTSSYQLTGLCFVSRPNWLFGKQATVDTTDSRRDGEHRLDPDSATITIKGSCDMEPFKRHFGWHLDDVVRVRLPAVNELVDARAEMADIYMDVAATLPDAECVETEQSHNKQLLDEIQKLKSINREMFRQLMDRELLGDW